MPTQWYPLYPDLVRQFFASLCIYYEGEAPVTAGQGVLTFMIREIRYRLSFLELCDIFGFPRHFARCELPTAFPNVQVFWKHFGHGDHHSKTTTQIYIRHPVLRCLARILSNTLLCKMELNKMRVSELIMMFMAIGDILDEEVFEWPELDLDVNLGAIFAHHLESLKTKPFTSRSRAGKILGRAKSESVGSLLTPIFQHFGIDLTTCSIVSTRAVMDIDHMERLRWLKPTRRWVFSTSEGDFLVQLPNRDLTDIGDNPALLFFTPAQDDMTAAPITRRRGTPIRGQAPAASTARRAAQAAPATLPPIPPNLDPFQEYVVQSLQAIWAAISRCSCMSAPAPHSPRSPSAPGPSRAAADTDDSDSEATET